MVNLSKEISEENKMENFIKVLKENPNHAYDYICANYWYMNVVELKDIIKELLYAIYSNHSELGHNRILLEVAEELESSYKE